MNISDWYNDMKSKNSDNDIVPRIILLDGTYSHSTKQIKFIQNHFDGIVPIVKLDLGAGCRSSIAGIESDTIQFTT
jgi:hypothetical protein